MTFVTIKSDSEEVPAIDVNFQENGEVLITQYHPIQPYQDVIILTPDMRAELVAILTRY